MKRSGKPGRRVATKAAAGKATARRPATQTPANRPKTAPAPVTIVAKVSHTLTLPLAQRLEEFAFFQRISESAVIEHALVRLFGASRDDDALGESLRRDGAGRRRRS